MKEKNYKSILGKNTHFQNECALNYLLNYGRINLQDDEFFDSKIKEIEDDYDNHRGSPIMTEKDYISIINISREMSFMDAKDLYDYIQCELCTTEKINKEVNSPEYDY